MSELITAARPYARAAFDVATKHNEIEKWTDMLNFMTAVAHDATMQKLLDSPILSRQQTANTFISACEQQVNDRGKNFICLLAENDKIVLLPEIAVLFHHYRSEAEGTLEAEVVSANEINDSQLEKIAVSLKQRLGKEVNLTSRIDAALIGGAIIRAGDLVIDGSVRGRLDKLSTALTN